MLIFKATLYDPTTAIDNLANSLYLCLGLLYNLSDLLRPVDNRLVILGILDIFCTLNIPFLPCYMVSHWSHQMDFEQKELCGPT